MEQQNFLPLTSLKQSIRKNNSPRSGGVDRGLCIAGSGVLSITTTLKDFAFNLKYIDG